MTARKKIISSKKSEDIAQKPPQKEKEELSRFTLAEPEEKSTIPTMPNPPSYPVAPLQQNTTEENNFWQAKMGKICIFIFSVSILLSIVGGFFIYQSGSSKTINENIQQVTPSLTPVENPRVSPTPTPEEVDVSKYEIAVLNGSGINGEAAKLKKQLETERFTVSSIGNADSLNSQKTVVQIKKNVPKEFLDKLEGFLGKEYILDDPKELNESEKFDAIVTIGNKKAEKSR